MSTGGHIEKLKFELQRGGLVLLDGAMGTELQRRGVQTSLPLWSAAAFFTHPDMIGEIHRDYLRAGAKIITTNTFRTNKRAFLKAKSERSAREVTLMACEIAAKARSGFGDASRLVAGSVAPLEDCYEPQLTPPDSELREEHFDLVTNLVDGGVDFVFAEAMNTIREARAVLEAAKQLGSPLAVSFVCNAEGNLLSGETIAEAVAMAESFDPLFISTNCAPPERIAASLEKLTQATKRPVGVYANGMGKPGEPLGWEFGNVGTESEQYALCTDAWLAKGAQIVGGCCGTTPEYIAQLAELLAARTEKTSRTA